MISRIKALLLGHEAPAAGAVGQPGDLQMAAAALLVEAALMDERFEESERAKIVELLTARFELGSGR